MGASSLGEDWLWMVMMVMMIVAVMVVRRVIYVGEEIGLSMVYDEGIIRSLESQLECTAALHGIASHRDFTSDVCCTAC